MMNMNSININEYSESLGQLIDVSHPLDYQKKHVASAINIYADKLLLNHFKYLDKNKTYYIMCQKGQLSKKVVTRLKFYGYKVIQVKY